LLILPDHRAMTPSQLGERLIVTRATVTGLVDSLEAKGFVRREPNPNDRRSLSIQITPAGFKVLSRVRSIVHAHEKRWMSDLDDGDLRKLIALLHRVQSSVERAET